MPKMEVVAHCSGLRGSGLQRSIGSKILVLLYACLAALVFNVAPLASAADINFSTVPAGNNPNPLVLPGATFTTMGGGFNYISPFEAEDAICPSSSPTSPANCPNNLEVQFSAPSSAISFTFSANNDVTVGDVIGSVQIFNNATLLGTANLTVQDSSSFIFEPVNLAGFTNVTEILISNTDFGGLLYSDFAFTPSTSTAPEPTTWLLFLASCFVAAAFRQLGAVFRKS